MLGVPSLTTSNAHPIATTRTLDFIDSLAGLLHDGSSTSSSTSSSSSSSITTNNTIKGPTLVVLGDQSSGKSSLLSRIANFPPNCLFESSKGMTTKCVTKLVLRRRANHPPADQANNNTTNNNTNSSWTAKVRTTSPQPFGGEKDLFSKTVTSSLSELRSAVQTATSLTLEKRVSGDAATVAKNSIVIIELESPDCPNVTLVDLPGLVRTHVEGQSEDIVDDVDNLVDYYISSPSSTILSLIPSNVDFATSSSLAKSSLVDPGGERTIGVLTKCDLVEEEDWVSVRSIVENKVKPLRLGYYMVYCKEDGEGGWEDEERFFSNHLGFRGVRAGTERLGEALGGVIKEKLFDELGGYKTSVERRLKDVEEELAKGVGGGVNLQQVFMKISQSYVKGLNKMGRNAGGTSERGFERSCFREFKQALKSLQPNFEDEESLKVLNAEVESFRSGSELPGFVSRQGMSVWISREVEPWRELARACASNVADMFVREGGVVGDEVCGRKHRLKGKFLDILRARVGIQLASVLEDVEDLVEGEKAMFTMSDEAIVEAVNAVRWQKFCRIVDKTVLVGANGDTQREKTEVLVEWYKNRESGAEEMSEILECYWKLASARFCDNVCMLVKRRIGGTRLVAEIQRECIGIGVVVKDKENEENVGGGLLEGLLGEEEEEEEEEETNIKRGMRRSMTNKAKGLRRKQLLAQQQGLREARKHFADLLL
ncbi:hypothetical protein TrVE_jg9334 [Triparma verrucosa]|uniref:Dynamin-type G domain-containing protein n=1 Tax=Triparma verrucosa TaxID=1606542 RepID=A0A9W7FLI9_9STRA|nr:hypothetical protein TrVE_jg9334 [Triparma verrucosa]